MSRSWKITALAPRPVIEAALIAHEDAFDWDPEIVLSGSEIAEDRPDDWRLEAWLPRRPTRADKAAIAALFAGGAPGLTSRRTARCRLGDAEPARARADPRRALPRPHARSPAARCTGCARFPHPGQPGLRHRPARDHRRLPRHADAMKRRGVIGAQSAPISAPAPACSPSPRSHLWPRALATASDIDPVCVGVVEENAALNGVPMGARRRRADHARRCRNGPSAARGARAL